MIVVPLLLAGLAGASEEASRRARLQELKGRLLGAGPEEESELERRIRWCHTFLREPRHQWTFQAFLWNLHLATSRQSWPPLTTMHDHGGLDVTVQYVLGAADGPTYLATLDRSDWAPVLPWMARELVRGFDSTKTDVGRYPSLPYLKRAVDHNLLDWYQAVHPDLTRLTAADALGATEDWHRQFAEARTGAVALPGVMVATVRGGGTIERLVTKAQLAAEGEAMGHCIGGYNPTEGAYFSWRDAEGVPRETAEVVWEDRFPRVVQHVSEEDGDPDLKSPLSAYLSQLQKDTFEVWADRDGKPMVVKNGTLALLQEEMRPKTEEMEKTMAELREAAVASGQNFRHFSMVDQSEWDAFPRSKVKLMELTEEARAWSRAFVSAFNAHRAPKWSNFLSNVSMSTDRHVLSRWPSIRASGWTQNTFPYPLILAQRPFADPASHLGWSDGGSPKAWTDPLAYYLEADQLLDEAGAEARRARLRTGWDAFRDQITLQTFTRIEAAYAWKWFVTKARERGAWPAGQRLPKGAG